MLRHQANIKFGLWIQGFDGLNRLVKSCRKTTGGVWVNSPSNVLFLRDSNSKLLVVPSILQERPSMPTPFWSSCSGRNDSAKSKDSQIKIQWHLPNAKQKNMLASKIISLQISFQHAEGASYDMLAKPRFQTQGPC